MEMRRGERRGKKNREVKNRYQIAHDMHPTLLDKFVSDCFYHVCETNDAIF